MRQTFVTNQTFALLSTDQGLFKAAIACDTLKDATLSVCAELPGNWYWEDFKGLVYMNIFNTTSVSNVSRGDW